MLKYFRPRKALLMTMNDATNKYQIRGDQRYRVILPLLLAVSAVLASFLWQGHLGLSLEDEGFLWYGAQRVLVGEVPIRDFVSYDPGRYYWIAAILHALRNESIIGLRMANAITQAIALFMALVLIDRTTEKTKWLFLALSAMTLLIWMYPWFKQVDIALCMASIGVLSFLIHRPISRRYFFVGLAVGLVSVFSRYHGLYGAVGSLGVMGYLSLRREHGPGFIKGFAIWSVGVFVGYAPILLMIAFVPGFAQALREDIQYWAYFYKISTTLISMPWPWSLPFGHLSIGATVRGLLTGSFFLAYPVFGVCGIAWAVRQKLNNKPLSPELVAAAFMALPYAHYAYSAPESSHLALGSFPFLIGSLILLANMRPLFKWPLFIMFFVSSLIVLLACHPGYQKKQFVDADIAGTKLKIFPKAANYLKMLNKLVQDYAPEGRSFLALPAYTTSYSIWKRKAPLYEMYTQGPRSEAFQKKEIERIKKADPGFAVVTDAPVFGRDDLRYSRAHPLIYKYIVDHFELIPRHVYTDDPAYSLYKAKH